MKDNYIFPSMNDARKRTNNPSKNINRDFDLPEEYLTLGKDKKYYLRTYGCQANVRDGETISGLFEAMGFVSCEDEKQADVILFNTCAIRKNAEDKVLGELGNIKTLKKTNPDLIIGICGCMAQEEGMVNTLLSKYPQVDLIFGTHNIDNLPKLLHEAIAKRQRTVEVFSKEGDVVENLPVKRYETHRAWVNIMYGCDKFCTYCIVPYTRGKQRSRDPKDILEEIRQLVEKGYKEVTLLGQNVNAYGKDLDIGYDFADLLEEVAKSGIKRVRFMTSHPFDFTFRMVDVIADNRDVLMPYIHLPVQSGNDEVLKLMGRRYDRKQYLELFDYIRKRIPECTISTDIIVGFPTETQQAFEDTLSLVDYCKFDNAFTFIYSPREGTPAARMKDDIGTSVKEQRLQTLNAKIGHYALENNQKYQDRILEVMVDGPSKRNQDTYSGYSREFKLVNFKGNDLKPGDIVNVKITKVHSWSLDGETID